MTATLSSAMWGDKGKGDLPRKGPPITDGVLTVTPDTPEILDWRARSALDVAETSSTYLDEDEDDGPKPHELYGKFTWKISNFSDISKRELRSTTFDVGGYKWYILVYPQGCDVCNHLSLFLCVADYDKLLPGWSHFAQFTIAVVNKDPKKSKYSDTLHRFCKKEHDWGWKKFMELSKVLDGFTVADTLVIKAQVQVILDKPGKPFRCLDPQYRRELVRVYLTNVEGVCRRFCDEKRSRLVWAKDEALKFRDVWRQLSSEDQRRLLSEKADVILKGVVKQFFNEKEVTSTLVMDALYSGCKQIDEHSRMYLEGTAQEEPHVVLVRAERNVFMLNGDIMELADRATKDFIPISEDESKMMQPNDGLSLRSGQDDDYRRDTIERDEKRLAELGRKTVEMFVISQVFTERLEVAYREAEALKRQDQLIAEELALQQLEDIKRREQAEREREKRSKKKERMKLKKEAERVKKDAEDAERRTHETLRREEQGRKAAEAAVVEKKRQNEAPHSSPHRATKQHQGSQSSTSTRSAQEDTTSAIPHPQSPQPSRIKSKHAQQQTKQQQQPSLSISSPSLAKPSGPISSSASTNHCHQPSSSGGPYPSPAASSQQPPLSRPLQMTSTSMACSSRRSGRSRGMEDLALGSSASSSQDRAELVESEDGGAGAQKQQVQGPETDSVSDRSDELEVELLRTQVHQLQLLLAERDAEIFALHAQLNELQPLAASTSSLHAALAVTNSTNALADGSPPSLVSRSSGGIPFASVEPVESAPCAWGTLGSSSSGVGPTSGQAAAAAWGGSGHRAGAPSRPSPPHQQHQQHKAGLANGSAPRQQLQQQHASTSILHVGSRDGELTRTGSTSSLASSAASEVVAPLASTSSSGGATAGGAAKAAATATANGYTHTHHHHHHHLQHHRATGEPASSSSSQAHSQGGASATRRAAAGSEAGLPSGVPGAAFDSHPSTSSSSTAAGAHLLASPVHQSSHARANGPCISQPPLSPVQLSQRSAGTGHQQPPAIAAAPARMQRGETNATSASALLPGKSVVVPPPPPPPSSRPSHAAGYPAASAAPTAAQALLSSVSASSSGGGNGAGGGGGGGGSGRLRTPSVTGQQALASTAAGPASEPPSTSSTNSARVAGAPLHALTPMPATAAGPTSSTCAPDAPAAPSYRNAAAGVISGSGLTGAAAATTNATAAAASQKQHAAAAAAAAAPAPSSSSAAAMSTATPSATSSSAAAAAATSKPLNASATEFTAQRLMLSPADSAAAAAASTSAAAAAAGVPSSATVPVTAAAVAAAAAAAAPEEQEGSSTPAQQARLASQLPADSPGLDDFAHMGLIDDLLGAE